MNETLAMPKTLMSWNVNGIRAVRKKGFLDWLEAAQPDVLGLQETKISLDLITDDIKTVPGYHTYWACGEKKGYSGVAILSKQEPLSVKYELGVPEYDREGRVIVAEYPEFTLFNIYFPNGQMNEERLAFKLGFYDACLAVFDDLVAAGKNVIICGDFNTAHHPIDLARPKENVKVSGFLPIERAWLDQLLDHGYIDTFREFETAPHHYSWWNVRTAARERNVGWRIDYFFASSGLKSLLSGAQIHPEVMGSDHCPVSLQLNL
jgi:exodeoxyribonuclease III